ncbi:nuclease-related domain-containing protein [Peribacillus acanthi]|uniref:nuclease-related domain-containing protein n=1 Tax=Peribacillus acanthi TaxID=2171554 RepID=UPI000D3E9363|nr:nuclease-related domain-containing protein [Peribacillus acanthi]
MIIKDLKIPLSIQKLQALERRLPSHHQKIPLIKEELKNRQAGYNGETAITFPLSFLDPKSYHIFRGLRLLDQSYFFQMDILILSASFILIIEVKNFGGKIFFDPVFKQLIQTKDGKEMAYPDPIIQVKRHEMQLKKWLSQKGLPQIPIYSLVLISNPRTIIRTTPENHSISNHVLHRDLLPLKIIQIEKSNPSPIISDKEMKKIIRLLKKQHTEGESSILEQYQINQKDILKGIFCPQCSYLPIHRHHGAWFCPKCKFKNKDAHFTALHDYRLLFGPTITNSQIREYLILESSSCATRLLSSINLPYSGTKKDRVYHLAFNEE